MAKEAWVTLATNDTYAMSALVLAESLNQVQTTRSKVIVITSDVTDSMKSLLEESFTEVVTVNVIDSKDEKILTAMKRPELGVTLTKIHCWSLTQYDKCVFLDADTLFLKNADELFDRQELSAVPDIGWPDCFNSGVFVFVPSQETLDSLTDLAAREGSFDGGDQGLLNTYFSDWFQSDSSKHLSFVYNMTLVACYSYPPAYKKFGTNVKIVHFLGSLKPWHYSFNASSQTVIPSSTSTSTQQMEHVQHWWRLFASSVQPRLTPTCSGICAHLARLDLSPTTTGQSSQSGGVAASIATPSAPPGVETMTKRRQWESGQVDYMGGDSFENIQKKLDEKLVGNQ